MRFGLAIAMLTTALGCTEMRIAAPDVSVPVSASGAVHDADLRVCRSGRELEKIGQFEIPVSTGSLFWGLIPFGASDLDLSAEIERFVRDANAQAVTNLTVEIHSNAEFNQLATLIPLIPVTSSGVVTGELVRQTATCSERDEFAP